MQSRSQSGHILHGLVRNLAVASTVTVLGGYAAFTQAAVGTGSSMQWPVWGGSVLNKGFAPNETKLSPSTVPNLTKKWVFTTHASVASTPTVDGDYVYATDLKGYIYKLNRADGTEVWETTASAITGKKGSLTRNTAAITDTALIFGDQLGATVMAINKSDGKKQWAKTLPITGSGHITSSPMVYNGRVYVGVASFEEGTILFEGRKGPSFQGSVWVLDATSGDVLWSKPTVPTGYTGGGVWSSPIVVDAARGSIYVTTGDNYTVPDSVSQCLNDLGTNQDPTSQAVLAKQVACLASDDYVDSVVAYDMNNGNVKWARRLQGADAWNAYCLFNNAKKCSFSGSTDWDFGAGANLIDATINGQHKQLVGAGQKNGIYWALDPDTGATVWAAQAGPPSLEGGIEWGTATDDQRVYVGEANFPNKTFTLLDGKTTWNHGLWAGIDAATGTVLWQTKPPKHSGTHGQTVSGAISVANGVVYGGSLGGFFVAMDAATGKILWSFQSGGSVIDAPSIVDGVLYWGSGYGHIGHPNNQLYAFTVP
jgi:polyvinyl alcohol dehydrogenase (cytochrome)